MGVLAGVAEIMGVESLLLLLLLLLVVVVGAVVDTDGALEADALVVVLVAPVADDFLVAEEEETRAFLGGVLVDLGVVWGTDGSRTGGTAAPLVPALGDDTGFSTE